MSNSLAAKVRVWGFEGIAKSSNEPDIMMFKIGKSQIIMTSFFAMAFLGTLPAIAELGNVWTDFQYYTSDFRNYITNNISDSFQPVELQTQSAISGSSGDLNIPNPNAAAESVRNQITQYSISDKFENNPAVYGTGVSNEINRYITRGSVEGLLGRDGQTRLKTKLEETEKAVQDSNEAAQNAAQEKQKRQAELEGFQTGFDIRDPNTIVQNNLLKTMAQMLSELEFQNINIQREQTRITGETLGNTIQLRNDIQYSNLNLANISQQMDETNRARRVETSAEVARLLRVTSQTDLFRKNSNSASLENNPSSLDGNSPGENNPPSLEENSPLESNPSLENSPPPVQEPGE